MTEANLKTNIKTIGIMAMENEKGIKELAEKITEEEKDTDKTISNSTKYH